MAAKQNHSSPERRKSLAANSAKAEYLAKAKTAWQPGGMGVAPKGASLLGQMAAQGTQTS